MADASKHERAAYALGLALIVAVFVVRVPAAWFAYPFAGQPDEPYVVEPALAIARSGDLHPRSFHYPSLCAYLVAAWFAALEALGVLARAGEPASPDHYVAARLLMLALAAAGALASAELARRLGGTLAGIAAGLVVCASPAWTAQSFVVSTNPANALFSALACIAALEILRGDRRWRRYLVAAAWVGFTIGTKYIGFTVAAAVVLAHALGPAPRASTAKLLVFLALVPVLFVVTTPYALIDLTAFVQDVRAQHYAYTHDASGAATVASTSWGSALKRTAVDGIGLLLVPVLAVGALALSRRERRALAVLGGFALAHLAFVGSFPIFQVRNAFPIVPVLAALCGIGLARAVAWAARRSTLRAPLDALARALVIVACVAALALPARSSWSTVARAMRRDSRAVCLDWIREHAAPGSRIVRERRTPPIESMLQGFEVEAVRSVFAADAGVDLTRFDYAILSDADQRVVERFELYARERELARDFAAAHVPVLELVPERDSLSGPTLRVYRLPDAASR